MPAPMPIRIVDITEKEYIEIPLVKARTVLYEHIKKLEDTRNAFLDKVDELLEDKKEAVLMMVAVTSGNELTGKASVVQHLLTKAAEMTQKINKLFTFANNYAELSSSAVTENTMIRLTIDQAKEFGL